jgi:hypothetical protein
MPKKNSKPKPKITIKKAIQEYAMEQAVNDMLNNNIKCTKQLEKISFFGISGVYLQEPHIMKELNEGGIFIPDDVDIKTIKALEAGCDKNGNYVLDIKYNN